MISLTMVEIFCKAVILYIAQKQQGHKCYIMITECTQSHLVEKTRAGSQFRENRN